MSTYLARRPRGWARLAVWLLVLTPTAAHAQSTLTGVVRDTSGAVLPGVTVEAASPVLIEKMRSAVTDSTGSYRIVDLRPGVYTLTFTLTGFSIVKREAIELPANFTMTINGDLKVGALEETLTVTGAAPTVDVQSTTKAQVLNRDALDAIPTGRTIQGMGQLITGVSLNIPDVGGSRAMQQTYVSTHGLGASQTTVQVDGADSELAGRAPGPAPCRRRDRTDTRKCSRGECRGPPPDRAVRVPQPGVRGSARLRKDRRDGARRCAGRRRRIPRPRPRRSLRWGWC